MGEESLEFAATGEHQSLKPSEALEGARLTSRGDLGELFEHSGSRLLPSECCTRGAATSGGSLALPAMPRRGGRFGRR
ncbi:MAG: hypothetical protein H6701_04820 [Myxococcales bacterium]|nr:hypothetical protein [Myxococcales bacterium]